MPTAIDLDNLLRRLPAGELLYHPNRGNAGDALIAVATLQRLRRLGRPFQFMASDAFDAAGRVVLYGGGGNLVPLYEDAARFVERHHRAARRLVVLPQTVAGHEPLLASLGSNVTIVCREPESFAHVQRSAPRAEVLLAHDLALGLDTTAVIRQVRTPASELGGIGRAARQWLRLAQLELTRGLGGNAGELNAFRTDRERSQYPPPVLNHDVSRLFSLGCSTEAHCSASSQRLLSVIDRFDRVNTNRLHVAIAGALLGKDVKLYPNSYYKCRAVYEFSLAGRFRALQWMGDV